jgi:glycosyltransferase involved in cell wall biosynthesis
MCVMASRRNPVTVVCPSLGRRCGVAEYTKSLCEATGAVPASGVEKSGVLLHVQHENWLYDDEALYRDLAAAREEGAVIVVTEHTATPAGRIWDALVDVWITHTALGYDWLVHRCPASYVTRIPHGCPTWFPPTKKRAGATIGTFGFLGRSKGHAALMHALDVIPGLELLVYGTVPARGSLRRFTDDYQGRSVRHVNSYLPEQDVVAELAAQADILVFWYDENLITPGTSGAVTVGLATGVPVITSPTTRFAELRSCTYQPPSLIEGIQVLLDDEGLRTSLAARARLYCAENSWPCVGRRHRAVWAEAVAAGQIV